jgi:hypothetical protein
MTVVFDGVGEGQLDWGYFEAPESYTARIMQIVADLAPKTRNAVSQVRAEA